MADDLQARAQIGATEKSGQDRSRQKYHPRVDENGMAMCDWMQSHRGLETDVSGLPTSVVLSSLAVPLSLRGSRPARPVEIMRYVIK